MATPARTLLALALLTQVSLCQEAPPDLLSDVEVGQRWVFVAPVESSLTTTWTVTRVDRAAGTVEYDERLEVRQPGEPVVVTEPVACTWRWSPARLPEALPGTIEVARETLRVGERDLGCVVVTVRDRQGAVFSRQWTRVNGDVAAFPGIVRLETRGSAAEARAIQVLVRVEVD